MQHGNELIIVATLCTILVVGLLTRSLSRWSKLPYTVLVLLAGLAVGLLAPDQSVVVTGDQVTPDLLLFVFLPILVFESAFSMQLPAVRRDMGTVLWLAGPALIASTVGVAGFMVLFTSFSWQWGWTAALVFGALISATDPVAVVALLRELGAPKRLSVLIEGESLFNDGTAIVAFTLLLGVLSGAGDLSAANTLGRFVMVAGGGLIVGLGLSVVASAWLRRTFNQPVVEITLTLCLAYLAMVVAESIHVSGVIAVVVAGLWMSGPGRVTISPEVHSFLHRFWQVLAALANTLIFFLVGLVVAESVKSAGVLDLLIVLGAFVGIVALRVVLVFVSRPAFALVAEPVSKSEAAAMAWGGLRGAVSLALGLMVHQQQNIPQPLRDQMLLVTAGVVLGTLIVNGTTIGWLLRRLKFDQAPAAVRWAQAHTRAAILDTVDNAIAQAQSSPDLRTVNWATVRDGLKARRAEVVRLRDEAAGELVDQDDATGAWRQALSVERTTCWDAFARGTLGPRAVQLLDTELEAALHRLTRGHFEPEARRSLLLPGWRGALQRWLNRPGRHPGFLQSGLLELRYELARGTRASTAAVLQAVERGEIEGDAILPSYRDWNRQATELVEDFRANLPELTEAIETRIAMRISMNLERDAVAQLESRGALDPENAERARVSIEERMKRLGTSPRAAPIPDTTQLCRGAGLFEGVDEAGIAHIAKLTTEKALAPGEVLFEQGSTGGNLFIVARGAVAILREDEGQTHLLDVLGSGDVLGEMELLTGEPRTATIRALTTCLVGEIDRAGFEALMTDVPEVADRVREQFARRRFDNHIRTLPAFAALGHQERMAWFGQGRLQWLAEGDEFTHSDIVFVVNGSLSGWAQYHAPALVHPRDGEVLKCGGKTQVLRLPRRDRDDGEADGAALD